MAIGAQDIMLKSDKKIKSVMSAIQEECDKFLNIQ